MSRHQLPHCLTTEERCFRCCGSCKRKPIRPLGGFTIPLPATETTVATDADLVLVARA